MGNLMGVADLSSIPYTRIIFTHGHTSTFYRQTIEQNGNPGKVHADSTYAYVPKASRYTLK